MPDHRHTRSGYEVTGRMVLFALLGFFGVVFAVNAVMLRAATSTFGGIETESAYRAGLLFKSELAAARAQDELRWEVNGKVARTADGQAAVEILVRDPRGFAPTGILLDARLAHPTDFRNDHSLALVQSQSGVFRGEAEVNPGQWNLVISIYRGEERVFLSRSRITLR